MNQYEDGDKYMLVVSFYFPDHRARSKTVFFCVWSS